MRWCVALALISTLVSPDALAAGKKGGKAAKKKDKAPAATMDTGGDPVAKEQSDGGPYRPKGTTGALKEKEESEKPESKEGEEAPVKARPRDKRLIFADFVFGFGQAPKPGPAGGGQNRTAESRALGAVVGAAFDVSKSFTLGIRIPWSTAAVDRATRGGSDSSMAFGSPELMAELRHPISETWSLPILFGIGVPLAQGDPDPSQSTPVNDAAKARVGLLADAASGWRDGELYAPKRLPLVLGAGVQYGSGSLDVHAYTKVVAGFNLGTKLRNPLEFGPAQLGELKLHSVSFRDVTLAGIRYDFLKKPVLWAGADLWLVYSPLEPIKFDSNATPPSAFQFVVEPRLGAAFGKVRPSVGFIYPLGGRLADAGIAGVRAHVDFAF
jgi:hypothetical protein